MAFDDYSLLLSGGGSSYSLKTFSETYSKGSLEIVNSEELFKRRDLMPTSSSFGWLGNVLKQHWEFTEQELAQVFPSVAAYDEVLLRI